MSAWKARAYVNLFKLNSTQFLNTFSSEVPRLIDIKFYVRHPGEGLYQSYGNLLMSQFCQQSVKASGPLIIMWYTIIWAQSNCFILQIFQVQIDNPDSNPLIPMVYYIKDVSPNVPDAPEAPFAVDSATGMDF